MLRQRYAGGFIALLVIVVLSSTSKHLFQTANAAMPRLGIDRDADNYIDGNAARERSKLAAAQHRRGAFRSVNAAIMIRRALISAIILQMIFRRYGVAGDARRYIFRHRRDASAEAITRPRNCAGGAPAAGGSERQCR